MIRKITPRFIKIIYRKIFKGKRTSVNNEIPCYIKEDLKPLISNSNIPCLPFGFKSLGISDNRATLVWNQEENRVYRYIRPNFQPMLPEVLKRINSCIDLRKMVVSHMETSSSPGLLEQQFIHPVTRIFEWPPSMVRSYALYMLDFIGLLDKAGLSLIDMSNFNTTFFEGKFVFYDIGAITVGKMEKNVFLSMLELLINPIILMSYGEYERAHHYLRQGESQTNNVGYRDIKGYMPKSVWRTYKRLILYVVNLINNGNVLQSCTKIKKYVESSFNIVKTTTQWESYSHSIMQSLSEDNLSLKYKNTVKMIREIKPSSFIDLAGNGGVLSVLLNKEVKYSICMDLDMNAIDFLYQYIVTNGINTIYPVFRNILDVSDDKVINNINMPRLRILQNPYKSDCAVGLAILHHLIFTEALTFDSVLDCFFSYTDKYLIIEYIDISHKSAIIHWGQERLNEFTWYSRENFEKAVRERADIISVLPSGNETTSLYLLLKRG